MKSILIIVGVLAAIIIVAFLVSPKQATAGAATAAQPKHLNPAELEALLNKGYNTEEATQIMESAAYQAGDRNF